MRINSIMSSTNEISITNPRIKRNLNLLSCVIANEIGTATIEIAKIARLVKLCEVSLEKSKQPICISTIHRLCISLATYFFLLLDCEGNLPEILNNIRITMTCMRLLAEKSTVGSQIICRALLERTLDYGYLFNSNFDPTLLDANETVDNEDNISLAKENLKATLNHRFRRLPNEVARSKRIKHRLFEQDRISINCCLLEEAFRSCINTKIEEFANLFVEFHCPVMFDKLYWPNVEALRTIDERNLRILRRFQQVPPFWDLYELIGEHECLKSCTVLVKALFASHLALWASANTQDRLLSTSRLIPPLAQSKLIPKGFGLAVKVFPLLTPSEVYAVMCDIWQYLKDTNTNGQTIENQREYLHRLRLIMCKQAPGSTYVKIFGFINE